MNKLVIIDGCEQCWFFDNEYYSYEETCTKLDRKINSSDSRDRGCVHYPIPDNCPLTTTSESAANDQ